MGELAAIDFGLNLVGWAAAATLQTEKFYDVTGSLTYWILILRARGMAAGTAGEAGMSVRQQICSLCVLAWAARLGSMLVQRAHKYGDRRFDKVKTDPKKFLLYWTVQAVWCYITALPVYMTLSQERRDTRPLGWTDYASWLGWLAGMTLEIVADRQKSAFKDAGNTGFISTGLWKYSQHPNYFGEMFLWASLSLSCLNSFGDAVVPKLVALGSPAFVFYMLRYVSGVPLLQKMSLQKFGKDAAYNAYRARTSLLVPWFPQA